MAERVSMHSSRRQEILRSTIGLLAEHGYDKLTFDALATAAKTSKATLYRHWSSKFELVVEALTHLVDQQPRIDSGTLRQDLIDTVLAADSVFDAIPLAAFNATIAALPREPDAAHAFVRFFLDENPPLTALWARAVARGEVSADTDVDLLTAALFHGLHHLTVLRGQPMDVSTVARVVDTLVMPAATGTADQPV